MLFACVSIALLVVAVLANTEKVIFRAPSYQKTRDSSSEWLATYEDHLCSKQLRLRRSLRVLPTFHESPYGTEHWYLLRNLTEGQRYEVRICWPASQPTDFRLEVFDYTDAFIVTEGGLDSAHLAPYRYHIAQPAISRIVPTSSDEGESILALRIQAKASFVTNNKTLMQHPPPVDVDIILDPYHGNVFPASLVPTAVYIGALAVIAWYLSGYIWTLLVTEAAPAKTRTE